MTDDGIDARRLVPDVAVLRGLMQKYFIGPIDDTVVAKLHRELDRVLHDDPELGGHIAAFHPGNGGRAFGRAWREELSFERAYPRSIDLAAWLAWSKPGFPPARPYCPDRYAGHWLQVAPASAQPTHWQLDVDGTFRTAEPSLRSLALWCVHRSSPQPTRDDIWLDDESGIAHRILSVYRVKADELALFDIDTEITYFLKRA